MKNLILSTVFFFLAYFQGFGCLHAQKPTQPPLYTIRKLDTPENIKTWKKEDLFVNEITPLAEREKSDYYSIDIRAFRHSFAAQLPKTWVLGYVPSATLPGEEALPGPFIEVKYSQPTTITWKNKLRETMIDNPQYPGFVFTKCDGGASCKCPKTPVKYYPIIYNVNTSNCIHGIQEALYDTMAMVGKYEGANYYSTSVHLHGANVSWMNDGYPNSKYLTTPGDTALRTMPIFTEMNWGAFGPGERQNAVTYNYPNTFPEGKFDSLDNKNPTLGNHGALLWYHDHSMMRTAVNVYAGLVGPYIIEGEQEELAFEESKLGGIPDVPLLITDKCFTKDGFLYYYSTQIDTIEGNLDQPEFYGNTIVVNGKVWPKMEVGNGVYRFRIFNTSSSRTYNLALCGQDSKGHLTKLSSNNGFVQIGTEGGLMPAFFQITSENPSTSLILSPGERADVLINFSAFTPGLGSIILANLAINSPYGADELLTLDNINDLIDNGTLTNVIMSFAINPGIKKVNKYQVSTMDSQTLQSRLDSLSRNPDIMRMTSNLAEKKKKMMGEGATTPIFKLTLKEYTSVESLPIAYKNFTDSITPAFPMILMNEADWNSEAYGYVPIKKVKNESTEIWEIDNATNDAHPIHLHLNRFKILKRVYEDGTIVMVKPGSSEYGWKDVVRAAPHCKTYIEVKYISKENDVETSNFLYHCHILEHEDMSMMRRLIILPK